MTQTPTRRRAHSRNNDCPRGQRCTRWHLLTRGLLTTGGGRASPFHASVLEEKFPSTCQEVQTGRNVVCYNARCHIGSVALITGNSAVVLQSCESENFNNSLSALVSSSLAAQLNDLHSLDCPVNDRRLGRLSQNCYLYFMFLTKSETDLYFLI